MNGFNLDYSVVDSNVKPPLRSASDHAETAYQILRTMVIPSGFGYSTYLRELPAKVDKLSRRISNVQNWLEESIATLQAVDRNSQRQLEATMMHVGTSSVFGSTLSIDAHDTGSAMKGHFRNSSFDRVEKSEGKATHRISKEAMTPQSMALSGAMVAVGAQSVATLLGNAVVATGEKIEVVKETVQSKAREIGTTVQNGLTVASATIASFATSAQASAEQWYQETSEKVARVAENVSAKVNAGIESAVRSAQSLANSAYEFAIDTGAQIEAGVTAAWSNAVEWVSNGWNGFTTWVTTDVAAFFETVWQGLKSTAATLVMAVQSLLKGVLKFGEALIDFCEILGTAVMTPLTALEDGFGLLFGNYTGVTAQMWDNTMADVATQKIENAFNHLYTETAYGRWLSENAFDFMKPGSIGANIAEGVGYIAGVVGLTVLTLGVGTGAVAGSTGAASVGAASSTAASSFTATSAAIAAAGGVGKGSEKAWGEGAGASEGLLYGLGSGAWEGLQYFVGAKIGTTMFTSASTFLSKLGNSGIRVVLDSIDGAVEVPVQSALRMIYTDESYTEAWNSLGGFKSMLMNAGIGGIASGIGEGAGLLHQVRASNMDVNGNQVVNGVGSEMDPEMELGFFSDLKNKFDNKIADSGPRVSPALSQVQIEFVQSINARLAAGETVTVAFKNTAEISSTMLSQIDDLSRVNIQIIDGLGDTLGNLRPKYNAQRYVDRITYRGFELESILQTMEGIQAKIDMNLPVLQRARQLYDTLASDIPVMWDYDRYATGHQVSASLRGLTSNNSVGKMGLVCAGYSSVFKELCDRLDIPCEYIRGQGIIDPIRGDAGPHAWNVVITENGVCPVDVTWKASGSADWFGASEKFAQTHIADADEMFCDYAAHSAPVASVPIGQKLDEIVQLLNAKHGSGEGVHILQEYLRTGNGNIITRTGDARNIVTSMPRAEIEQYLSQIGAQPLSVPATLDNVISILDTKYGSGQGEKILQQYLSTNNPDFITRSGGARDIVASLSQRDIKQYLEQLHRPSISPQTVTVLNNVLQVMDAKYGANYGRRALQKYLETGNLNLITSSNGARDWVARLSTKEIQDFLSFGVGG